MFQNLTLQLKKMVVLRLTLPGEWRRRREMSMPRLTSIQVVTAAHRVHAVVGVKLGVRLVYQALLGEVLGLFVFFNKADIRVGGLL